MCGAEWLQFHVLTLSDVLVEKSMVDRELLALNSLLDHELSKALDSQ